jgi:hypothetical protein
MSGPGRRCLTERPNPHVADLEAQLKEVKKRLEELK